MREFFLETDSGNIPLSNEIVKKYALKKGRRSPFLNCRIVDSSGDFTAEPQETCVPSADEGQVFSTAEMIDFMQGADSSDA